VGGLDLRWGNAEAAIKLLDMIIHREGIGDVLADGVKRAAQKIGKGSDQFAIHAGGQELPMHDPRYDPGFGAHYAVEPTPGRHTISSLSFAELLETDVRFFGKKKPMTTYSERYNYNNKGPIMAKSSTFVQVLNGAGLCMFGAQMGAKAPIFQYLNTATGWSLSDDEYMEIGERIQNLRIAYNVREGVTIKDTQINRRALGEPPLEKGPNAGITVDSEALCRSYYKEMGWDYDAGKPTEKKLEQLGLIDVKDKLYSAG